jgi:calcineurin-like phosphoesterase family protein
VLIPTARLIIWLTLASIASCTYSEPYCLSEDCVGASLEKGNVDYRILLVGDTGANVDLKEPDRPFKSPLFTAMKRFAELMPTRTAIVFLGDNIYSKGLPDIPEQPMESDEGCVGRACAERRLDVQIDILKESKARGIFIPGNHDWDSSGKSGWKRIQNLEEYIENSKKDADVILIPKAGCPGPVTVPLSGKEAEIALIGLDTQWWLHKYKKPGKNNNPSACKPVAENEILRALKSQIEEGRKNNRHILLVGHHPLITYGKHSGYFNYKDLLDPIHLFSQFMLKAGFSGRQEFPHPIYRDMRVKVQGAIQEAAGEGSPPLIYAAGHDHSLQVIKGPQGVMHLVSGAGTPWKGSRVGHNKGTLFSHSNKISGGFIAVDFMQSGKVRLAVIEPRAEGEECKHNEGNECVVFSTWVKPSPS